MSNKSDTYAFIEREQLTGRDLSRVVRHGIIRRLVDLTGEEPSAAFLDWLRQMEREDKATAELARECRACSRTRQKS